MFLPSIQPSSRSSFTNIDQGFEGWTCAPADKKPMRWTFAACCACAANGQAAAVPPISVMNSRRFSRSNCICFLCQICSIPYWRGSSQGPAAVRDFDPIYVGSGFINGPRIASELGPLIPQQRTSGGLRQHVRLGLPAQPVDTTQALNL